MEKIGKIEVYCNAQKAGTAALTAENLVAFEYDAAFLKSGFSVSPYFLPLQSGVFVAKREPFWGNFGVFDDSLPDGWGSLLLDRFLREQGIDVQKLTVLQRLALVGTSGRGALEFFPDKSITQNTDFVDFDKFAAETHKILENENYTGDLTEILYRFGGSSGGARPKIFVKFHNKEWLVKFPAINDKQNIGQIEYEYSLLAKKCGIEMPETRLFEGKYFGTQRFDRTENGKIHTISAAGLLNANYRLPVLDYIDLLKVTLDLTRNMQEVEKMFRLAVFNAAVSNRDDHAKNFSFQYKNDEWQLSPAYDLLPSTGFNGWHTTTYNGKGEAKLTDIFYLAEVIALPKKNAKKIVEQIIETCKQENKLNGDF
ncbi:MAG: type II toxin-antitoxin system HipA family toxin [Prevotellaceae bacterium]|jgi:serine/threonine-protein kinase HipA|nr:type II toxin-antitoxin system HipA family toxin [Prevotellaceae bacterium]